MSAYYNEIDPYAAEWLRTLILFGLIADGEVDTRSISDVHPDDIRHFDQCHFFAGIGVWSLALRAAGWADERAVWTGSCPCQPFSVAGRTAGFHDERHLWPHWHHLIRECRPRVVFGEQVASKDGLGWFDLVHADLEGEGYAVGAVDLCAAGVGAPHMRQRLFFAAERMGHADDAGLEGQWGGHRTEGGWNGAIRPASTASEPRRLDDAYGEPASHAVPAGRQLYGGAGNPSGMADTAGAGQSLGGWRGLVGERGSGTHADHHHQGHRPGPVNGYWRDADWLFCRDGRWRPVEPGTFPLVDRTPGRVGRLRAYGNAIVAPLAAEMIRAFMECRP